MRGIIHNAACEMSKADILSSLERGKIAHAATVGEDGYPYVIPLVYIYERLRL